jgi:hypothetical protein
LSAGSCTAPWRATPAYVSTCLWAARIGSRTCGLCALVCALLTQREQVLLSATLLPVTLFAFLNLMNLFLFASGSSGAVPFGTMLAIVALWFLVSVPLTGAGAYLGIKHGWVPLLATRHVRRVFEGYFAPHQCQSYPATNSADPFLP